MMNLFCGTKATTNEEYKKSLKTRMRAMLVLFVLGVITIIVSMVTLYNYGDKLSDFMRGMYSGVGTGLVATSIILYVKNRRTYRNEEKIRQERIERNDERNWEISNYAIRASLFTLLVVMYVIMLIGGLWYPIITQIMVCLVCFFLAAYLIFYKIYSNKL